MDELEIGATLKDHEGRIVGLEGTWNPWSERLILWQTIGRFMVRAVKWIGGLVIGAAAVAAAWSHLRP